MYYKVYDKGLNFRAWVTPRQLQNERWDAGRWYQCNLANTINVIRQQLSFVNGDAYLGLERLFPEENSLSPRIELNGVQVPMGTYPALERNSTTMRDFKRAIPEPVVVIVHVEGRPARALIDTGSLADFMSLTLAEQIKAPLITLEKPLTIQLAVQGSRSRVNYGTSVRFQYQGADYRRYFDVMNLQNYDLILGTPFMYQHSASVGLNASRVILGSVRPLPLQGSGVTTFKLESRAAEVFHEELEKAHELLKTLARPICGDAANTALPPL